MVDQRSADLDRAFRALASAPRREILRRTARQRCSISELATHFDMSLPAVSKHVRVLADAGLLSMTLEGRTQWCRLEPRALARAQNTLETLAAHWERRLDALESLLVRRRKR
ncbi:MAG: transcriptional regulator [Archangium gephyra]|uniref:Transcriptional regulator n=1 Tax=Archangium gephyra TaxID=48 RepID=A0A2W5THH0_9BACT|nr:MAG: transcriptional regulator [Archangium gephyra]